MVVTAQVGAVGSLGGGSASGRQYGSLPQSMCTMRCAPASGVDRKVTDLSVRLVVASKRVYDLHTLAAASNVKVAVTSPDDTVPLVEFVVIVSPPQISLAR